MHSFFSKKPNGKLGDIIIENQKSKISVGSAKGNNGILPFFTSGDAILRCNSAIITGRNIFLNTGGNADVKYYIGDCSYSTDTWCITCKNNLTAYLYLHLLSIKPEINKKFFKGTGLKHIQKDAIRLKPLYIPNEKELVAFNSISNKCLDAISKNWRENDRLCRLRDYLLPLLMNGQVSLR